MQKLYSECIGMPVVDEASRHTKALVQNILIDPENGKVVAFRVRNNGIIVPLDIEQFGKMLVIADSDRILPINDVLRAAEVQKMDIQLIGTRVYTKKEKQYLGRVVDYAIDSTHMVLYALHIAKVFFFFRLREQIIPYTHIVSITREKIIVMDPHEAVMAKAQPRSAFAS